MLKVTFTALMMSFLWLFASIGQVFGQVTPEQKLCFAKVDVEQTLIGRYSERLVFGGSLGDSGMPMYVYVNREKGNWTIVIQPEKDVLCLVLAGHSFFALEGKVDRSPRAPQKRDPIMNRERDA